VSIRRYSSDELSNMQLGQGGFDMLSTTVTDVTGDNLQGIWMTVANSPKNVESIAFYSGAKVNGSALASDATVTSFDVDSGEAATSRLVAGTVIWMTDDITPDDGDTELMLITNVSSDTITVERGYLGTTATTHADNKLIAIYKEAPGLSHWVSIKSASQGPSNASTTGLIQAIMINEDNFQGKTAGVINKCHPCHITTADTSDGVDANTIDVTRNNSNATIPSEGIVYGRFTLVFAGNPSANSKTNLILTRGYK